MKTIYFKNGKSLNISQETAKVIRDLISSESNLNYKPLQSFIKEGEKDVSYIINPSEISHLE